MAELVPPGANVAVDEMTGAMRDASDRLFPGGPPLEAAVVVGAAQLVKTPDEISCIRRACQITEQTMAEVQKQLVPASVSSNCPRASCAAPSNSAQLPTCWMRFGR